MTEHVPDEAKAINRYKHYMRIGADDLLAEYASVKVRGNRCSFTEVAIEEAFEERRDEMDDYQIVVQER